MRAGREARRRVWVRSVVHRRVLFWVGTAPNNRFRAGTVFVLHSPRIQFGNKTPLVSSKPSCDRSKAWLGRAADVVSCVARAFFETSADVSRPTRAAGRR